MALRIASTVSNYGRLARPPRVTSRTPQPTTGTGRIVRPMRPFQPSWGTTTAHQAPAVPKPAAPAPAAAPPAPVTFANLAPAQLPVDPSYEATVAAATKRRDDTLLGLAGARTQGLQDYGYTQAPTGAVAFDPSNPFSRAALLRKNYMESKQGTQTGMAARGQLYAGALQTAQAANDTNFNQGDNGLQRALLAFLTNNQGSQNRARSDFESAVAQAMADRVIRAQQDLANNPPVVPDAAPAEAAAVAAPPPPPGGYGTVAQRMAAARRRNPRGVWGR